MLVGSRFCGLLPVGVHFVDGGHVFMGSRFCDLVLVGSRFCDLLLVGVHFVEADFVLIWAYPVGHFLVF